jgi:hypothetical protein
MGMLPQTPALKKHYPQLQTTADLLSVFTGLQDGLTFPVSFFQFLLMFLYSGYFMTSYPLLGAVVIHIRVQTIRAIAGDVLSSRGLAIETSLVETI